MDHSHIDKLEERRKRALGMGGEKSLARQKERGRLNVRERLALFFDKDTFFEIGLHADHSGISSDLAGRHAAADGVVTGWGKVDGRTVFVMAYDFTVLAGTMGRIGEAKCAHIRELALRHKKPVVWLIDSGGARVQELGGSFFSTTGYLFREQVTLSGVVPQVSVVLGPGAAGTAYIPALSDCVIMVKGQGTLALGGPLLVEAVLGEKVSEQELGGSGVHMTRSGVAHLEAEDDASAMTLAREYLSYFPSNAGEKPPVVQQSAPVRGPDRLYEIVPDDASAPFDMKEVVTMLADDGRTLELMPDFGRSLLTILTRIGGYPVGVVASQSLFLGGVLENDSSVKAARFVTLCDAFGIPLLFLQDVPGFLIGSRVERSGIIRHGAKMLFAVSRATVPKITIIVRKAYGAGYFVMCGRAYEPDYIAAWPTAEIALMGAEGAVNIMHANKLNELPPAESAALRTRLEDEYRAEVSAAKAASLFGVDDIIDPRDTAAKVAAAIEMAWDKQVARPERKHGIFPV